MLKAWDGKNAAKRGLLVLMRAEARLTADCIGGSRVRRGLVAEFRRKIQTGTAAAVVRSMTSTHRSRAQRERRRDLGFGIVLKTWVDVKGAGTAGAGTCANIGVRVVAEQCKGSECLFWCSQ